MKNKKIINSFNRINCSNKEEVFQKIINRRRKNSSFFKLVLTACFLILFSSSYQTKTEDTKVLLLGTENVYQIFYNDTCYMKSSVNMKAKSLLKENYVSVTGETSKVYNTDEEQFIIIEINNEKTTFKKCH